MKSDSDKGTEGNRPFTQEASQRERKALLTQDAASRTYFEMAQGEGDNGQTPVVAAAPFGPKLPAPKWSLDLAALPPEPPLGEDVNALPDCSGVGGRGSATEGGPDAEEA